MIVDYYALLEVNKYATLEEIRQAFKRQAVRWHPDRNRNADTTPQMQLINEAYLILKDSEARKKFDVEYQLFNMHQKKSETSNRQDYSRKNKKYEYPDYSITDDLLENWIANARKQAVNLAQETIKDFKGMAASGIKEGAKASGNALIGYIIFGLIASIVIALVKGCN